MKRAPLGDHARADLRTCGKNSCVVRMTEHFSWTWWQSAVFLRHDVVSCCEQWCPVSSLSSVLRACVNIRVYARIHIRDFYFELNHRLDSPHPWCVCLVNVSIVGSDEYARCAYFVRGRKYDRVKPCVTSEIAVWKEISAKVECRIRECYIFPASFFQSSNQKLARVYHRITNITNIVSYALIDVRATIQRHEEKISIRIWQFGISKSSSRRLAPGVRACQVPWF